MQLVDLQNIHKNKLCFIAGSSPSLRHVNYTQIKEHVLITVNSAILKYPDCNYFVTDDEDVVNWNYWYKTAVTSNCIKLLFEDKLKKHVADLQMKNLVFYKHRFYQEHIDNEEEYDQKSLRMYEDAAIPIIGARSSIASAINIAVIMGCNPICLLGVDNHYEGNRRYFWQFDGESKAYNHRNKVFSSPNKGLINNKPVDNHCTDYLVYWKRFAKVNSDFISDRIINSSTSSLLGIFPKIAIEKVLTQFGDRKNV